MAARVFWLAFVAAVCATAGAAEPQNPRMANLNLDSMLNSFAANKIRPDFSVPPIPYINDAASCTGESCKGSPAEVASCVLDKAAQATLADYTIVENLKVGLASCCTKGSDTEGCVSKIAPAYQMVAKTPRDSNMVQHFATSFGMIKEAAQEMIEESKLRPTETGKRFLTACKEHCTSKQVTGLLLRVAAEASRQRTTLLAESKDSTGVDSMKADVHAMCAHTARTARAWCAMMDHLPRSAQGVQGMVEGS